MAGSLMGGASPGPLSNETDNNNHNNNQFDMIAIAMKLTS